MTLDPRTPVIVGVGQVLNHPENPQGVQDLVEPVDLMVNALRAAAEDIDGASPGGPTPVGSRILGLIDRLASVSSFTWRPTNPSLLVAERLGISPKELQLSATGGSMPQKLMADGAMAIQRGDADVVAIVGSEAMHSRSLSRRHPEWSAIPWVTQDPASTLNPRMFGSELDGLSALEIERGIVMPVHIYPLFENARRARMGWTLDEHRKRIGAFWSTFSEAATANPHAWIRQRKTAEVIIEPSSSNRMIAEPYTKLMVANLPVDMGAAIILCSYGTATSLGIRDECLVFPHSHAQGDDPHFISDRAVFDRSIAIELAGRRALELDGLDIDDIAHVDLYSCFPIAAVMGAEALGLPLSDPARPLSLTGGLTFGGGPGNNYVTHSIATMVERLRQNPGDMGLVSGLSWFATSHSVGLYSTTPPSEMFRSDDVQVEIDKNPLQETVPELSGPVMIETYTIVHDRDEGPIKVIAALNDAQGRRSWGTITDTDTVASLSNTELIGMAGILAPGGALELK